MSLPCSSLTQGAASKTRRQTSVKRICRWTSEESCALSLHAQMVSPRHAMTLQQTKLWMDIVCAVSSYTLCCVQDTRRESLKKMRMKRRERNHVHCACLHLVLSSRHAATLQYVQEHQQKSALSLHTIMSYIFLISEGHQSAQPEDFLLHLPRRICPSYLLVIIHKHYPTNSRNTNFKLNKLWTF